MGKENRGRKKQQALEQATEEVRQLLKRNELLNEVLGTLTLWSNHDLLAPALRREIDGWRMRLGEKPVNWKPAMDYYARCRAVATKHERAADVSDAAAAKKVSDEQGKKEGPEVNQ